MARVWKEFRFSRHEHFLRMAALLHDQHPSLPVGAVWRFEGGPNILVTNLGGDNLRRLAQLDGLRLPEYVRLPDDDPIVLDILGERS